MAGRQGESNHGSRFDTPELRRAMSRCIHAGNPKWTAVQLGLDYTTVCAWGQRHPNAPPGVDRPRLNGPAKQLAILMDSALSYTDDLASRDEIEAHREDALAPLHWLAGTVGLRVVEEQVEKPSSAAMAGALLLKTAGSIVARALELGADGLDDAERAELEPELRGLERRVLEMREAIGRPSLRAVGGAR